MSYDLQLLLKRIPCSMWSASFVMQRHTSFAIWPPICTLPKELRLIAEHELLLEDQRGRQEDIERSRQRQ
jgi:hypothetical protein